MLVIHWYGQIGYNGKNYSQNDVKRNFAIKKALGMGMTKSTLAISREFSRFAKQYSRYNIVQTKLASLLAQRLPQKKYHKIADIGCGSGAIYEALKNDNIVFDSFYALDISPEMLKLHPDSTTVHKGIFDFNDMSCFLDPVLKDCDIILSSSSLQWCEDLDSTLRAIANLHKSFYATLFTSGTFRSLHAIAQIQSPIYSQQEVIEQFRNYFEITFEVLEHKLYFENNEDLFRYIKRSGVSGGQNLLSVTQMRQLLREYRLDYLEFEAVVIVANPLV